MRHVLLCLVLLGCSDPPQEGCSTAVDCADGQLCREGVCITPAPCDDDRDCAANTVCHGGACLALPCDGTCAGGRACVAGFCAAAEACDSDDDCPGTRCDRATGVCGLPSADCGVLCADAGGCAADEACPADHYCAPEGCRPGCRADGCGAGEACDLETRTCRCLEDAACPEGTRCADGVCTEGCRSADDCPEPQICREDSHTCGCTEDAHCAADAYCADGVCAEGCRLGGCVDDVCDPATRRCGPAGGTCVRDLDCPPEEYCLEGLGCAPGCREGGCPAGQACDLASRQCRCADDSGCGPHTWCDAGSCVPGCKASGEGCATGVCDPVTHRCHCENDGQCVAGTYCAADLRCTPGCRLAPDDCEAGRCNPASHQCEVGPCGRDADCPNQQACLLVVEDEVPVLRCGPALADGRAEAPCRGNLECASRICLDAGYCFSACERDADCPGDRCATVSITVDAGDPVEFQTCAPPLQACAADVDCPMGQACQPSGDDPAQPARPLMACRIPDGLPGGAACADGGACASGVCLEGTCWRPCAVGGANHCPAGQACYPNQFHFIDDHGTPALPADDRFWGMAACVPAQGSDTPCPDGRCPGAEVCVMRPNQVNNALDLVCRTPVGAGAGGVVCRADAECRSGRCVNDQFCFGVCDARNPQGQCAGPCGVLTVTLNDRDPATPDDDVVDEISACLP